jgi:hypothetical protein
VLDYLVQKLRVVPQEEAVARVLLDHLLVMHLDPGPVPTVPIKRHRGTTTASFAAADPAVGAQLVRAEAVDPEAPGQEQRVLRPGVGAATDGVELPEAQLPVLRVGLVLVLLLLVGGGVAGPGGPDRLERRRGAPHALAGRQEGEVVVVRRRAAGQVPLRAGAAQALVVGAAGQVAGDGRRVVRGRRRLREVDGRGGRGNRRRVAARRVERAEDRRGGAPHQHGGSAMDRWAAQPLEIFLACRAEQRCGEVGWLVRAEGTGC